MKPVAQVVNVLYFSIMENAPALPKALGPSDFEDAAMARKRSSRSHPNRPTGLPEDYLSPDQRSALGDRVHSRKEALGITNAQIAQRAHISVSAVDQILAGKQSNLSLVVLTAMARALECDLAWLMDWRPNQELRKATLQVTGKAEVGAYNAGAPQIGGTINDIPPIDKRYADSERFGVLIADDSLEGLSPSTPRGVTGLVIAFDPDRMEIESGTVYLMRKTNRDGQVETAFRRVTVYHDRYEFAPVYRDAARNEADKIVVERKEFAARNIEIAGIYYGFSCLYG